MKFLKEKIFVALITLNFFGNPPEASAQVCAQKTCMEILVEHSKSPTPFLSPELIESIEQNCNEPHFYSSNALALAKNLLISQAGFFASNILLFHQELFYGEVNLATLFYISSFEIGKNLINYVITENGAAGASHLWKGIPIATAILSAARLNRFRRSLHLPNQIHYSDDVNDYLTATGEILKNFVNFVITENTFPSDWSKPPVSN